MHYYVPRYSGKAPELIDGDMFRVIVPLDDEYSYEVKADKNISDVGDVGENVGDVGENEIKNKILSAMRNDPKISAKTLSQKMEVATRTIERNIRSLKEEGIVERVGAAKGGKWVVK